MTVWGLIAAAAEEHPDRVVFRDDHGRALTSAELRDAAERTAAGLGVGPGDVVSWQLPTALEGAVLLAALARVGAVQNPIIPILRDAEVGYITEHIGTTVLVVPATWRGFAHGDMARRLAGDGGYRVVELDFDGPVQPALRLPQGDPSTLPPAPSTDDDVRWIYFTSGTTAAPKGVRHTDRSVIASSNGMVEGLGFAAGDVYPIAWPYTHIGGITMTATALRAGGELVLFDVFDPATTGERMAAHQPTILGTGVPFFRVYLDAQRRHGAEPLYPELRVFTAGGSPTPPEMLRELGEVFGVDAVINAYGLTEFPIAAAPSAADPAATREVSVGRAATGAEARVVDGELRLRGEQCFSGYVDPSLDAHAYDDEGWFRTGDLATIDAEGFITITGRLKDVIIRNGENISALEIEDMLLRHDDILDVAVIGLPDTRTGERVCAVVVPVAGRAVDLASVAAHCQAQGVARQKTPEQVVVVESIPRNPMGKIVKTELRDQILGA